MNTNEAAAYQRRYYEDTANRYDAMHVQDRDEHGFALGVMVGLLDFLDAGLVLDVGSGTGRVPLRVKAARPGIHVCGVEPVEALRKMGHAKGLSADELQHGDALNLPFADNAFDLVCEYGVLHHVAEPRRVVSEILWVARKAVFISDSNNFGQGSAPMRWLKQSAHHTGLWPLLNWVKTGGKGYSISEGDGLAYSYSVFSDYEMIRRHCASVHLINTLPAGINPYRSSPHVALLGIKS